MCGLHDQMRDPSCNGIIATSIILDSVCISTSELDHTVLR